MPLFHRLQIAMSVLKEAEKLVTGDRNDAYGHPSLKYAVIAEIWSAILQTEVTPEQVVLCMIGTKLGRESLKHKRDNIVDLAGYAKIYAILTNEE